MTMRYAVVDRETNQVTGLITMEGEGWQNSNGYMIISDQAQLGWKYDLETQIFSPPDETPPNNALEES